MYCDVSEISPKASETRTQLYKGTDNLKKQVG